MFEAQLPEAGEEKEDAEGFFQKVPVQTWAEVISQGRTQNACGGSREDQLPVGFRLLTSEDCGK